MPGRHAAGRRRSGHALMARAARAAAPRLAGVTRAAAVLAWRAAGWVTRVIVLPLLAALWARSRPVLRQAAVAVRDWLLRHLNARDITVAVMIFSFPLAEWAQRAAIVPRHRVFIAGATTMTACGVLLWLLQCRAQRKWRRRGGEVISGGGVADLRAEVAALRARLDGQDAAWAAWADATGIGIVRRTALRVVKDGGESA